MPGISSKATASLKRLAAIINRYEQQTSFEVIEMRVWDVHPGYLSRSSLLGQHVEIHAVYSVITGKKQGYARHPETMRWRNHLAELVRIHDLTVGEMLLRGFEHNSPLHFEPATDSVSLTYVDSPRRQFELLVEKYTQKNQQGRIPLPRINSEFWAHHHYSVLARGVEGYKLAASKLRSLPARELSDSFVTYITEILRQPVESDALNEVAERILHLIEDRVDRAEQLRKKSRGELWRSCFHMAEKYHLRTLLQSTIFADTILP